MVKRQLAQDMIAQCGFQEDSFFFLSGTRWTVCHQPPTAECALETKETPFGGESGWVR